jgi:hypothetical protein
VPPVAGVPPACVPAAADEPPLPPVLSLLAQEVVNVAKTAHTASEAKARLTFTIILFLAFMSPSRLVFAYSIAERPDMGKYI